MNTLDIIIAVPLAWAVYQGFRAGIISQLAGLIGIILGIWLALRFSGPVGDWFGIDDQIAPYIGFLAIVAATMLVIGLAGWLLGKVFNLVGLGIFNRMLGIVLSLLKTALILSVLLSAFRSLNEHADLIDREQFGESLLYPPIGKVSDFVFPYFETYKDKFLEPHNQPADENGISD